MIYYVCGQLGCGPKVYGSFNGGRLEEFIPSRRMVVNDLHNPELRKHFTSKLARFHNLKFPITSKGMDPLQIAKDCLILFDNSVGHEYHRKFAAKMGNRDISWLFEFDWRAAYEWMIKVGQKVKTRQVLCTNDMNTANALIREEVDTFGELVTLVDYEFASMNPRGKDLGNHFLFHTLDVDSPTFLSDHDHPSEDFRRQIISDYLEAAKKFNTDGNWDEDGLDSVEHVLLEAEYGLMQKSLYFIGFVLEPKLPPNPMATDADLMFKFYVSYLNLYLFTTFLNFTELGGSSDQTIPTTKECIRHKIWSCF